MEKLKEALVNGRNVLITGGGGVGKTYTVNNLIKSLPKFYAMTATTGCASNHINGETLHRFFGLKGYNKPSDLEFLVKAGGWSNVAIRLESWDGAVIDESSMLLGDTLDLLDLWLKKLLRNKAPFGGFQLILVGDFLQIPPVVKRGEEVGSRWLFESRAFKEGDFVVEHLTEVKRQSDKVFIDALNDIRFGNVSPLTDKIMQDRQIAPDETAMILCSRNKQVDVINERELSRLKGRELTFKASFSYHDNIVSKKERGALYYKLLNNIIIDQEITLKQGCKVLIANNCLEGSYVNGNIGIFKDHIWFVDTEVRKYEWIEDFARDHGLDYTMIDNRYFMSKSDHTWEFLEYRWHKRVCPQEALWVELGEGKKKRNVFVKKSSNFFIKSSRFFDNRGVPEKEIEMTQFPVKLGYAITIHKAQGMTLDSVLVDCKQMFADGQVYVGLSRAKSLEGLYIDNWNKHLVKADQEAVNFYKEL